MDTKKIIGIILQIPLYLLVLGSFAASIYAAYNKIQGVTYTTPIILAGIIVAFIIGSYLRMGRKEKEYEDFQNNNYEKSSPRISRVENFTGQN